MSIARSLVIPCYNERRNLEAMKDQILAVPDKIGGEIILVDNGSSDGTGELIDSLAAQNPNVVRVTVEKNIGYGYGVVCGLRAARGDFIGWTHADGQSNLFDAVTGFSMFDTKRNPQRYFIMGARKDRRFYDWIFTAGMAVIETLLFGTVMNDIAAQPKLMPRGFFESWDDPPNDFALDLYAYLMAKRKGLGVYKFSVDFGDRLYGESSWNHGFMSRLKLIKRTLLYSFALRMKQARGGEA